MFDYTCQILRSASKTTSRLGHVEKCFLIYNNTGEFAPRRPNPRNERLSCRLTLQASLVTLQRGPGWVGPWAHGGLRAMDESSNAGVGHKQCNRNK